MPQFPTWNNGNGRAVTRSMPSVGIRPTIDQGATQAVMSATQFVQGIARQREVVNQHRAQDYASQSQADLSQQWAQEELRLRQTAQNGDDYLTGVQQFFDNHRQQYLDNAPNTDASRMVRNNFARMQASAFGQATNTAARITARTSTDSIQQVLNSSKVSVFINPDQYEAQAQTITNQIDASPMDASLKPVVIQQQLQDLRRSQISGIIQQDPARAFNLLQHDLGLSEADQERLTSRAVAAKSANERATLAQEARADAETRRIQQQIYQNTARDGDDLVRNNNLTVEWLQQNKDNLSPSDYRYFNGELSGRSAAEESVLSVYTDLDSQARNGVNVAEQARDALMNHELSRSDYDQIMNRISSQNDLPSPYHQGERYLNNTLHVGELNPDGTGAAERRGNALRAYDDWFRDNPNATRTQAMEQAQIIHDRYVLHSNARQELMTMPLPRYFVGTRGQPNIQQTMARTRAAFQNHEITEAQYREELRNMIRWSQVINTIHTQATQNTGSQTTNQSR